MSRSRLVACSVDTGLVASSMPSVGVSHVPGVQAGVDGFVVVGCPPHFVTLGGQVTLDERARAGESDPIRTRLQRSSQ